MLPTPQLLKKVSKEIMSVPNRRKESKRRIHYCLFLLGYKSGLRVSEAVSFSLENKTKEGLYRVEKPKGKKERFVYIPREVIKELRKNNWQPNSTNRFNFYHFLKKIKRELNIGKEIELTPHTLRHAFTTYHAEAGMPFPLLQKLLGHSSIRTTALYWQNIHGNGDNDTPEILQVKNWLERPKPSQKKKPPITENFPEIPKNFKPIFIVNEPVIPSKKPIQQHNSLSTKKVIEKIKEISTNEISPSTPEKFLLNNPSKKTNQLKTSQPLTLTANKEQNSTKRELILLQKIKHLEKQLTQIKIENKTLTAKLAESEKQKARLETIASQEKKRTDNYHQQLKAIVKVLKQWQKISYYQQLEQEQTAQIEQSLKPPPNFK
jgi:hypothetical protein